MSLIPAWHDEAACALADPRLFDPDVRGDEFDVISDVDVHRYAISRFCTGCPVVSQCHATAIRQREFGVWGGRVFENGRAVRDFGFTARAVA